MRVIEAARVRGLERGGATVSFLPDEGCPGPEVVGGLHGVEKDGRYGQAFAARLE